MPSRPIALLALLAVSPALSFGDDDPLRTASLGSASVVRPTGSTPAVDQPSEQSDVGPVMTADALTGEQARAFQLQTLYAAAEVLDGVESYTAELTKQERIDGELTGRQRITFKQRYAPFSVYMKWKSGDRGREAIYVDGANDNRTVVHAGGWKARFLPVLTIDPQGSLAMGESRHPITKAGLRNIVTRWITAREADAPDAGTTYRVEADSFEGAACHKLTAEYIAPATDPTYRKVVVWIDATRMIPVAAVNYGWGEDDASTLLERYEYRDIDTDAGLADIDFDRSNRRYSFKK